MIRTCLMIDDDADDQELFAIAVSEIENFKCSFAVNGTEALKMLNSETNLPDLIFLDLNMPRMSGKECLAELKKHHRLKNIPVIIFSTSSDPRDMEDTRMLGAIDFIAKPPSTTTLKNMLQEILEKFPVTTI